MDNEKSVLKKSPMKKVSIIMVLIVFVLAVIVVSFKFLNKEDNEKSGETISINDSRFIDVYTRLVPYTYEQNRTNGYKSFTNTELISLVIKDIKESDLVVTSMKDKCGGNFYYLKGNTIIEYLEKYFGSNIEIDLNALADYDGAYLVNEQNVFANGIAIEEYNSSTDNFKVYFACGIGSGEGPSNCSEKRSIQSSTLKDNMITVVEKAIYCSYGNSGYTLYSDHLYNDVIDTNVDFEDIDISDYLDEVTSITHVYKYDTDADAYYFYSSKID